MHQVLFEACSIAEIFKHDRVEPEHVIFALLRKGLARRDIPDFGLDPDQLLMTLEAGFGYIRRKSPIELPRLTISDRVMGALERAGGDPYSALRDLIRACPSMIKGDAPRDSIPDPLPDLDELLDTVERERAELGFDRICEDVFQSRAEVSRHGSVPLHHVADPSPREVGAEAERTGVTGPASEKPSLSGKERMEAQRAVERSIRDLTALYRSGGLDPVIGRDTEVDQICQILMRRRKSNVLLVGEPGVGKTALMEGVAARLAISRDPALSGRPVLQASLGALVAGARYRGDFEIRMELLVEHALARRAVLFFDEMQMLMGAGATAERGMDGANLLKPVLARDGMSLVGATTNEESEVIRADPALMRRFEIVMVTEPERDLMREILIGAAGPYLRHHDLKADHRVLDRMIDFADHYLPNRSFPDKAFDLLDMSCVQARVAGQNRIKVEHIRLAVRKLGGTLPIPQAERTRVSADRLFARLSERVGGHKEAVRRLADLVTDTDPSRPVLASLEGPAGIGRRTLTRELARALGAVMVEIDSDLGPDRLLNAVRTGLKPGQRSVFLVNVPKSAESAARDLVRDLSCSGRIFSYGFSPIDLGGSIILLRSPSEKRQIGFTNVYNKSTFDEMSIEKIKLKAFEDSSLREALEFELNRVSRIFSDAGESRPIPDVESVLCGAPDRVSSWSEIVRITREAAGLHREGLF